jgi:predicted alpha/beta superfamily hydrolase
MLRQSLTLLLVIAALWSQAQRTVTLEVATPPSSRSTSIDTIYVAGSFNNWNPQDAKAILLKRPGEKYVGRINMPAGKNEFKLTRGSWQTAESANTGGAINNRTIDVARDTLIRVSVAGWSDHFAQEPRQSTASKNVKLISTSFYIPQLNRYRRVWIYLPEGYASSRKRYPVLYMQDGQNVFEDTSSFSGEWGVDEALDSAGVNGEMIVVAVDHGGAKRLNEYAPFDMERYGPGEGAAYAAFLTYTLRTYIDRNFRTKKRAKYNYIAGSSMGGLIAFYTTLAYPKKWGAAGVFSPAFWVVPALQKTVEARSKKVKSRIYFYAGKEESERMVPDLLAIFNAMHQRSKARMKTVIRSNGKHNEATWRQEFPLFHQWLRNR